MLVCYINIFRDTFWPNGILAPQIKARSNSERRETKERAQQKLLDNIPGSDGDDPQRAVSRTQRGNGPDLIVRGIYCMYTTQDSVGLMWSRTLILRLLIPNGTFDQSPPSPIGHKVVHYMEKGAVWD
uniref:Sorting nexin 25 n=1 Tax=Hucho hucho TaxID=62062 RepID=A0A4W5L072_9TELE